MLLRDETQTALNQVERLCLTSADDYEAAAGRADDTLLAARLDEMARRRRALARDLAPHIRALDDLPQQPDPDREAFDHLFTGLKAMFSQDSDGALLEHCLRADTELQQAIEAALREPVRAETRSLLESMLQRVHQSCRALLQARKQGEG